MRPINILDLNNAQQDVTHIAEIATSAQATAVDRLGQRKRTISGVVADAALSAETKAGAAMAAIQGVITDATFAVEAAASASMASIGYQPPVAYGAGISITARTQTVSYAAQVFAPNLADLPFTTSGTFEAAKFRLISGVTAADLADASGAALVGNGGESVKESLDALQLPNYAALRAYKGPRKSVYVTGAGIAGMFVRDDADTASPDNGGTCFVDAFGRRWKRAFSGPLLVEWFGASITATASQNATAITAALATLGSGMVLRQSSALLVCNGISVAAAVTHADIRLVLQYGGWSAVGAAVRLNGFLYSMLDISINGAGGNAHGLRCENCTGSTVPSSSKLGNFVATSQLVAGIFTRDSDGMEIRATVHDITSNGTQVVRGIMVSDQTIAKNSTLIAPQVKNITVPADATVSDADGVYLEFSNPGHVGGIKLIGGDYDNCTKRFIKSSMPNVVISENTGRNASDIAMYSFVSSYGNEAGVIEGNSFEKTGAAGVGYAIEIGVPNSDSRFRIGRNSLKSSVVAAASYGFRVSGKISSAQIDVGDCVGFTGLFSQASDAQAIAATGQSLVISGGRFDNLNGAAQNGVAVRGSYASMKVCDVHAVNAVASRAFVSAPEVPSSVIEVTGNVQAYSFGRHTGTRPLNAWDAASVANNTEARYVQGRAIMRRNAVPTTGTWEVGDIVEMTTPAAAGQIGWVCTTAGTPGTWKAYGTIAA